MELYADIILPVPLQQLFTYGIPAELVSSVIPGVRVYVPFGRGRHLTGIVASVHKNKPTEYQTKDIISVLDGETPMVLPYQLKLIEWISRYYLCAPGDVMKVLLPGGLRPESKNAQTAYKPKTECFVRISGKWEAANPNTVIEELKKHPKKQDILRKYYELSCFNHNDNSYKPVSKRLLQEQIESKSALQTVIKNNYLELYNVEIGRLPQYRGKLIEPYSLTPVQQEAFEGIKDSFKDKNISLLYGVTSSGKTEIYIKLIKEQLEQGKQVLYLLPEIALTTQIMHRLQQVFGDRLCIYHSNCADNIRAEIWQRQLSDNPFQLILGARSAVMLPFRDLGLVIVDEEHETAYKQEDPAPRYNARNVAIIMASMCGAKTLLGSATPSFETLANAIWEKYGLITLNQRYNNVELPYVQVVDIAEMQKKKYMQGLFSPQMTEAVREALNCGEQVILFHNRRGYSGTVECKECGRVQKCNCCDVSLTYHKNSDMAVCHYCGRKYKVEHICPECGSQNIVERGYGTERVAEQLKLLVPEAKIAIMDSDTSKNRYEDIIRDFQDGITNVLIGTQMISKGFDFDNVSTVGVLQADSMMNLPDFRAAERTYQLIAQVTGRAGRRQKRGKVILQTRQPEHEAIKQLEANSYRAFFNNQMEERHLFAYPPYSRITTIKLKGKYANKVEAVAESLCCILRKHFGEDSVLGPDAPMVSKVNMLHIRNIILKIDHKINYIQTRQMIDYALSCIKTEMQNQDIRISFDVDPL